MTSHHRSHDEYKRTGITCSYIGTCHEILLSLRNKLNKKLVLFYNLSTLWHRPTQLSGILPLHVCGTVVSSDECIHTTKERYVISTKWKKDRYDFLSLYIFFRLPTYK